MKVVRTTITLIPIFAAMLLLSGCPSEPTEPEKKPVSAEQAGAPPVKINDAMSNPNVPESVKAQMKTMQQGGGGQRPGAPGR